MILGQKERSDLLVKSVSTKKIEKKLPSKKSYCVKNLLGSALTP